MDVSHLAPFSNVECPVCRKHTRVKREFGPYTLLRRHAIGGMSVVFIAHDNTLSREVVVKILNEEYGTDEKRIGAFEEEARITASFSHPHVVRVYTTGRAFGRFYIAMELVGGGHYEHHIRERGSIPEAELLPLAIQIADGLKAAQAAGLIHRDVKPGNILLDAAGNAKIVDFGLALVTKGGKAKATEIWATPYYVPPETIEGMQEDFRSDIYAFGATLYHALAGKPPCDEESMDTNKLREAKQRVLPLAKAAPWVSLDTCTAIDRAMAHDPEQRFRSYNDLISALETARQRLASGGFADTPAQRSAAAHSAKKDKLALIGASMLVTAALAFGIWGIGRGNQRQPQALVDHPPSSSSALPDAGAATPKSDGSRAGGFYRDAGAALRAGDYPKARELFAAVRDDDDVLEPTGSWAACEAVVAAYLYGESGEARREARLALLHVNEATLEMALRDSLRKTLEDVKEFRPVTRKTSDPAPRGPGLMTALVHGLKNWEQGLLKEARPHFDAILEVAPEGADAWLEPYKPIILEYVKDHEKLIAAIPDKYPDTAEACHGLANELHAVHAGLKTKGRAKYNIRAVQLDLEKRARLLETENHAAIASDHGAGSGEDQSEAPALDPLVAARAANAECRFTDAAEILKKTEFSRSEAPVSEALLALTEAAGAFLSDLEEKLQTKPEDIPLEMKNAVKLQKVTGSRPGGVNAIDVAGQSRQVSWSELSPDSVIELHRALVKDETSELERLRRHEQAIAFDLLAGNAQRAKEAAGVLASRYPAFKRRWDSMQPALR